MRRAAVRIAYLGKDYCGSQYQPGYRTVMGDIIADLERISGGKEGDQMKKIPYTIVLGDHERDDGTVTYRKYGEKEQITVKVNDFIAMIDEEIKLMK